MALVATVSVVATAGVAIWTKAIDAKSKRDDRHHELALEYEKRARQDKSNALKALISASLYVKRQARLAQDTNLNEEYPRAATI